MTPRSAMVEGILVFDSQVVKLTNHGKKDKTDILQFCVKSANFQIIYSHNEFQVSWLSAQLVFIIYYGAYSHLGHWVNTDYELPGGRGRQCCLNLKSQPSVFIPTFHYYTTADFLLSGYSVYLHAVGTSLQHNPTSTARHARIMTVDNVNLVSWRCISGMTRCGTKSGRASE